MRKLFRIDVAMCGTAYVAADTEADALAKIESRCGKDLEASVPERGVWFGDVPVSGDTFESLLADDAPDDVTLSPALTFHGSSRILDGDANAFTVAQMEQVAGDEDDDEDETASPDPATAAAGLAEAMGGPLATDSEIERTRDHQGAKAIKWEDRATVTRIQYEDGTGDLCDVVLREPPGLEIVGNGSLQAPLSVALSPELRAALESVIGDAESYLDDLESGLADGTYDQDPGAEGKRAAVAVARQMLDKIPR